MLYRAKNNAVWGHKSFEAGKTYELDEKTLKVIGKHFTPVDGEARKETVKRVEATAPAPKEEGAEPKEEKKATRK